MFMYLLVGVTHCLTSPYTPAARGAAIVYSVQAVGVKLPYLGFLYTNSLVYPLDSYVY